MTFLEALRSALPTCTTTTPSLTTTLLSILASRNAVLMSLALAETLASAKYSSGVSPRSRSIASARPVVSTEPEVSETLSLAVAGADGDSEAVGAASAGMKLEPTTKAVAAAATMPRCAVFLFGCGINASPRFTVRVPAPTLPQDARIGTGVVTKMKHYLVAPLFFKHRIQRKYKFDFLFGLVKIR